MDEKTIDKRNILKASMMAMHKAIDSLNVIPDYLLVDGTNFKPYLARDGDFLKYTCFPGGDNKYISIAAASILAKEARDRYIDELCEKHPELKEGDLILITPVENMKEYRLQIERRS